MRALVMLAALLAASCAGSTQHRRDSGPYDDATMSDAPAAYTSSKAAAPLARSGELKKDSARATISSEGSLELLVREEGTRTSGKPEAGSPSDAPPVRGRLMIYTAEFAVLVGSVADSTRVFLADVTAAGGHLQHQADHTITVRVPATEFQRVVDKIEKYGAIIQRNIQSEDVTRAVMELQLRLDNAEKSRARLLELLQRAVKMDEILEIEKELRRLTEEIELMKGQMRSYEDRIAFSTITVHFRSNAPEVVAPARRQYSPFAWINQIGAEHAY